MVASSSVKRRRLIIAVVAALVAAGSVVLLVNYLSQQHPSATTASTGPGGGATTKVVVAVADLKAGDQLSTSNVGLSEYPSTALPSGNYFTDVSKLLNPPQYTSSALPKGAVILTSLLVNTAAAGPTVTQPPIQLDKPTDVAISIPYSEANGAGGYIQTEDHLDMIVYDASGTEHYAFQDVRVIKVGGRGEQSSGGTAATANLLLIELPREQAATLAYLEDHGATIRYAIRPHDQYGKGNLPNSNAVSGSNWNSFLDG
ncbi:MAG: Flp pilus assembly protein CpaB [Candidatus Dormibacteria bacterium]